MSSKEQRWLEQRMRWEADPTYTAVAVSTAMGVSGSAVSQRMKKEGWQRVSDPKELARRANDRADKAMAAEATREAAETVAKQVTQDAVAGVKTRAVEAEVARRDNTADLAVDMRARILERHRKEVDGVRNILYAAIRENNFEKAKLGKITSETVKIIQDIERKAWSLDAEGDSGGADGVVRVVIERREVANVR